VTKKLLWPAVVAAAAGALSACATGRTVGLIGVGDTPEKVVAQYGKPDRTYKRQTASGDVEAWGYMPFWPGFSIATEPIGSRGSMSPEIPLEPIREDENMRVFFKQGKVVAVEYRSSK
jgi:hypothetical protein